MCNAKHKSLRTRVWYSKMPIQVMDSYINSSGIIEGLKLFALMKSKQLG